MKLLTKETRWNGGETVVALGMFDGVHEGHAQLIRRANHLAALYDLSSVVLTYDAHPLSVLAPEKAPRALSTRAEKVAQIARLRRDFAFAITGHVDDDHEAGRFVCSWATKEEAVDALIAAL